MARTKSRGRSSAITVASRSVPARRSSRRGPAVGRRRAAGGRSGSLPTGTQILMAAGLGWAQAQGHLVRVPTIAQLGVEGTIAAAAYFWRRSGGPGWAGDLCTAAAIVAANHLGREGLTGTPGAHGIGADDPYAVHGD